MSCDSKFNVLTSQQVSLKTALKVAQVKKNIAIIIKVEMELDDLPGHLQILTLKWGHWCESQFTSHNDCRPVVWSPGGAMGLRKFGGKWDKKM